MCAVALQEAYLPPVLQTTREMKATGSDDVSPPQLTRRKNYGATQNDHVIDASQLTPSSETVLTFTDEDRHQSVAAMFESDSMISLLTFLTIQNVLFFICNVAFLEFKQRRCGNSQLNFVTVPCKGMIFLPNLPVPTVSKRHFCGHSEVSSFEKLSP